MENHPISISDIRRLDVWILLSRSKCISAVGWINTAQIAGELQSPDIGEKVNAAGIAIIATSTISLGLAALRDGVMVVDLVQSLHKCARRDPEIGDAGDGVLASAFATRDPFPFRVHGFLHLVCDVVGVDRPELHSVLFNGFGVLED